MVDPGRGKHRLKGFTKMKVPKGLLQGQVLRETYFFVGRAKLDCLEGGTHEETLRPQVNPKV